MACGYFYTQREEKGNFYSNQMDTLLIERNINGIKTKSIPYTVNEQGGFSWVDFNKGFTSTAAWYIIAKNKFNPLTLTFSKENKKTAEINNE
jgi:hypothetical protein